jgi:hypothetical protein
MDSAVARQCTGHIIGWSAATIKEQTDQKQYEDEVFLEFAERK